jgi:phosphotransacetylase
VATFFSTTKKKKFSKINIRLTKELMADSKEEFKQYLDELGATMKERGLTENILQKILEEDE